MTSPVAWLEFADIEIASVHRTLTYLRRGLGCGGIDVGLADPFTPEQGYSDTYEDIYYADVFSPMNLAAYCDAISLGPYESPAADPAPWYSASRTESGDFLGYLIENVTVGEVVNRDQQPRGARGAVLGRTQLTGRVLEVSGIMFAADSDTAMRYGELWLTSSLLIADACGTAEARILPACGLDEFRTLDGVGLVDGPLFTRIDDISACCMQRFSFTLLAGNPYLQAPEETELTTVTLAAAVAATVAITAGPVGPTASIITLAAGTGSAVTGITIKATPTSGACPTGDTAETITYTIASLAAGRTLVIDAADRTIQATDSAGDVVAGLDLFTLSGIFEWMEIPADETWCFSVTATVVNPGTQVGITSKGLEL